MQVPSGLDVAFFREMKWRGGSKKYVHLKTSSFRIYSLAGDLIANDQLKTGTEVFERRRPNEQEQGGSNLSGRNVCWRKVNNRRRSIGAAGAQSVGWARAGRSDLQISSLSRQVPNALLSPLNARYCKVVQHICVVSIPSVRIGMFSQHISCHHPSDFDSFRFIPSEPTVHSSLEQKLSHPSPSLVQTQRRGTWLALPSFEKGGSGRGGS